MTPRYSGVVSYYRPDDSLQDFGEIQPNGSDHAPFYVRGIDLRRIGAAAVGSPVTFETGHISGTDHFGAINVEKIGP